MLGRGYILKWGNTSQDNAVKTERDVPGGGSHCSSDSSLVSGGVSGVLDGAVSKSVVLEDEATAATFPLPLSFISCA